MGGILLGRSRRESGLGHRGARADLVRGPGHDPVSRLERAEDFDPVPVDGPTAHVHPLGTSAFHPDHKDAFGRQVTMSTLEEAYAETIVSTLT